LAKLLASEGSNQPRQPKPARQEEVSTARSFGDRMEGKKMRAPKQLLLVSLLLFPSSNVATALPPLCRLVPFFKDDLN
jgi:hypothetical protein